MTKKIFIFLGHPDSESMCRQFADSYGEGAKAKGYEVRQTYIGDMAFDPILHKGYKVIQELEPDLKKFEEDVRWCNHLVIIYPTWWSTMPALFKGLIDRVWIPGFAFHFHPSGLWWDRILKGRSATVFVTSDSHPLLSRFLFGDTTNEIKKAVLWFAGFDVRIKKCGPMKHISPEGKAKWIARFKKWGERAY